MTATKTKHIPKGWEIHHLKQIASLKFSNVDKKTEDNETPVRLCNYVDVYKNNFITTDLNFMEATASSPEIARFSLKKGDVLITKDSEEWNDIAVPALVVSDLDKVLCGYHLAQIRPNSKNVIGEFLFRAFFRHETSRQFKISANGITRYGLSKGSIENSLFVIPKSIPEQYIIADILSSLDEAIDRTGSLIKKYQRIKQGLMQDLFRYGIDGQGNLRSEKTHRFKDSQLGRIPAEWNIIKIGEILSEVAERISMKDKEIYRLISIRRRNGGIFEREPLPGSKILTKDLHRVIPGTFLIANRQIVHGACAYVPDEFADTVVSTAYTSLKARDNCDILWFSWIAKTPLLYKYFLDASQGVVLEKMNFHLNEWFELPIALPSVPEQCQIATILNQTEEAIEREEMYKQKLIALKSGLMDDLLSGKVRVNHMIPADA
jgi:type I restriction enzyme S subunit